VNVIFMIGYAPDVICNKVVVEEGMDFINKPFNKNELLKKIRGVLDNSHIKFAEDKTCLVGVGTI
jgi:two-component system cell cycle sensor histidine kinase/response regulator CckA